MIRPSNEAADKTAGFLGHHWISKHHCVFVGNSYSTWAAKTSPANQGFYEAPHPTALLPALRFLLPSSLRITVCTNSGQTLTIAEEEIIIHHTLHFLLHPLNLLFNPHRIIDVGRVCLCCPTASCELLLIVMLAHSELI